METRANYLLVGSFVLLLMAGLLVFALWLARTSYVTDVKRYDIYFVGAVTGLKKSSFVSYRGIDVGEVIDIEIDPTNVERVVVTIEVKATTPIRTDTVASLEIQGLAGGTFILLSGGMQSSPSLEAKDGQRYPVIASVPSRIEQVLQSAPAAVERVNLLLARANELLSPENREAITETLKNFDTLTGSLAKESPQIEHAISDFSVTMANLRQTTAALDHLTAKADTTLDAIGRAANDTGRSFTSTSDQMASLVTDLKQTSKSLTTMSNEIAGLVEENRAPLRNFSSSGLNNLTGFMSDARELVGNLNCLTTEIERDPARFFFGNQQQGYDLSHRK